MFKKMTVLGALCVAAFASMSANAAEVSISKLRVNLENGQTADFLTVRNESDTQKEAFEISLKRWTEKSNLDTYAADSKVTDHTPQEVLEDTDDILASPKTMVIEPQKEKIVRIIVNNADNAAKNYSYRLIINQLPNHELDAPKNTVNLLFKISLPVFVYKDPIKTIDKIAVPYTFSEENHKHYITFKNNDTQHIQIQDIDYKTSKNSINNYVLPGVEDKIQLPDDFNQQDLTKNPLTIVTDKGNLVIGGSKDDAKK
jgi:fimbrial chaperone protein